MDDQRVNRKVHSSTIVKGADHHQHIRILHIVMVFATVAAVFFPAGQSTPAPNRHPIVTASVQKQHQVTSSWTFSTTTMTTDSVQMTISEYLQNKVQPRILNSSFEITTQIADGVIITTPPVLFTDLQSTVTVTVDDINFDVTPSPTLRLESDYDQRLLESASNKNNISADDRPMLETTTVMDEFLASEGESSYYSVALKSAILIDYANGHQLISTLPQTMDYLTSEVRQVKDDLVSASRNPKIVVGALCNDRDTFFDIMPSMTSEIITASDVDDEVTTRSVQLESRLMSTIGSLPPSFDVSPLATSMISRMIYRQGKQQALDRKDAVAIDIDTITYPDNVSRVREEEEEAAAAASSSSSSSDVFAAAPALLAMTSDPKATNDSKLTAATIAGIALAGVGFAGLVAAALSVAIIRRLRRPFAIKSYENQFSSDNCGYLDSLQVSYINSQTDILQESSDEMYSLDNDSFLNSLEAVTMVDNWAAEDRRSCTRV